jgi:hypothetical protein
MMRCRRLVEHFESVLSAARPVKRANLPIRVADINIILSDMRVGVLSQPSPGSITHSSGKSYGRS